MVLNIILSSTLSHIPFKDKERFTRLSLYLISSNMLSSGSSDVVSVSLGESSTSSSGIEFVVSGSSVSDPTGIVLVGSGGFTSSTSSIDY